MSCRQTLLYGKQIKKVKRKHCLAQKKPMRAEQTRIREESERVAARQQAAAEDQLIPTTTESSENSSILKLILLKPNVLLKENPLMFKGISKKHQQIMKTSPVTTPDSSSTAASTESSRNPAPQPALALSLHLRHHLRQLGTLELRS